MYSIRAGGHYFSNQNSKIHDQLELYGLLSEWEDIVAIEQVEMPHHLQYLPPSLWYTVFRSFGS